MKLIHLYCFIIGVCCLLLTVELIAQQGQNPFELTPRISTEPVEENTSESSSANPFDIIEKREADTASAITIDTSFIIEEKEVPSASEEEEIIVSTPSSSNPFEIITPDLDNSSTTISDIKQAPDSVSSVASNGKLLNGVIFAVLVFLALLASLFRSTLNKSFQAFFNDNLLGQIYREQNSGVTIPYLLFYTLFLMNAGIFVFLLLRYFNLNVLPDSLSGIIGTILVVSGVLLLKLLVLWLIGQIYPINKETKLYSFTVIIFSIVSGILLIPANIILAYATGEVTQYAIYAVLVGIGIIYLLRALRGVFIANRFLLFHKFHFLLYICTIEIAPMIVLYKFI